MPNRQPKLPVTIYRSRPTPITNLGVASQLREAFKLPEFSDALRSRRLMGAFFFKHTEVHEFFNRSGGPHYIQHGCRQIGFRVLRCYIDADNNFSVDYCFHGPREHLLQLAAVTQIHKGGIPVKVVTRSLTPSSEYLTDLSVIAVMGFYYVHEENQQ